MTNKKINAKDAVKTPGLYYWEYKGNKKTRYFIFSLDGVTIFASGMRNLAMKSPKSMYVDVKEAPKKMIDEGVHYLTRGLWYHERF